MAISIVMGFALRAECVSAMPLAMAIDSGAKIIEADLLKAAIEERSSMLKELRTLVPPVLLASNRLGLQGDALNLSLRIQALDALIGMAEDLYE